MQAPEFSRVRLIALGEWWDVLEHLVDGLVYRCGILRVLGGRGLARCPPPVCFLRVAIETAATHPPHTFCPRCRRRGPAPGPPQPPPAAKAIVERIQGPLFSGCSMCCDAEIRVTC